MFYLGDSDFCVIDNSTVSITDWIISYCGIQVSDRGVSLFYTLPVKTESEISNKEGSSGNATVEFLFHLGAEYLARWVLSSRLRNGIFSIFGELALLLFSLDITREAKGLTIEFVR